MSVLIILILIPVEDINKPIERDEADKLKKRIYIIMPIVSVVSYILLFFSKTRIYGFSMVLGVTTIVVSLIAGKIKNIAVHRKITGKQAHKIDEDYRIGSENDR